MPFRLPYLMFVRLCGWLVLCRRILDREVDQPLLAACLALRWLAGRVPLEIVYLLMRGLLGLAVLVCVPGISSTALTSRVGLPAVRP